MDKKREIELKPCPYCGGSDLIIYWNGVYEKHYARCHSCHMQGPEVYGREAAAELWNNLPRKVEALPDAQLDALEKLAGEATPGPWATYGNSQEILGGQICSGWHDVYGLVDGEIWVLMAMNSNMVEEEERQLPATEKDVRRKYAPGQAGRNARYVAAANPAVVLALIAEVRRHRSAKDD